MLDNPLISVLCPSYNHEKFVGYFIQSLLAQTYDNWELIIVDDCSTDSNVIEIEKYQDERIHLYIQDFNQGPGAALNRAFKESKGSYFVICASDDMLENEYFEVLLKYYESNYELVYSPLYLIDSNNNKHSVLQLPKNCDRSYLLSRLFYEDNCLFSPGMSFNRKLAQTIFPTDISMIQHQDYQWHIKLLAKTDKVIFCEKPYVLYRKIDVSGNLSTISKSQFNRSKLECIELMNAFLTIDDINLVSSVLHIKKIANKKIIPYFFAKESLKLKSIEKQYWGYSLIMKNYSDDELRKELFLELSFSFKDFLSCSNFDFYKSKGFFFTKVKFFLKKLIRGYY